MRVGSPSSPLGPGIWVRADGPTDDLLLLLPLLELDLGDAFRVGREWDVLGVLACMVVLPETFLYASPARLICRLHVASCPVAARWWGLPNGGRPRSGHEAARLTPHASRGVPTSWFSASRIRSLEGGGG